MHSVVSGAIDRRLNLNTRFEGSLWFLRLHVPPPPHFAQARGRVEFGVKHVKRKLAPRWAHRARDDFNILLAH